MNKHYEKLLRDGHARVSRFHSAIIATQLFAEAKGEPFKSYETIHNEFIVKLNASMDAGDSGASFEIDEEKQTVIFKTYATDEELQAMKDAHQDSEDEPDLDELLKQGDSDAPSSGVEALGQLFGILADVINKGKGNTPKKPNTHGGRFDGLAN